MSSKAFYATPRAVPYCALHAAAPFRELTATQRLYAHYMAAASWSGAAVVAAQVSDESLPLLRLCYRVFSRYPTRAALRAVVLDAEKSGDGDAARVSADDVDAFVEYAAHLYANLGNYVSFGDTKFVPACAPEAFAAIVARVAAASNDDKNNNKNDNDHDDNDNGAGEWLPASLLSAAYNLDDDARSINAFAPHGRCAYYGAGVTAADAALANDYLASRQLHPQNTRVFAQRGDDGDKDNDAPTLVIRVASAAERRGDVDAFRGRRVVVEYGDFAPQMRRVVACLTRARAYAADARQRRMLDAYVAHFARGDVEAHKESQREWVRDVGPAVETNIGFIESYRDPSGVRAEWEGFVAVVNAAQSRCYADLVARAPRFIARLPWGAAFEKDAFTRPDFTSLDVVAFAASGLPSGICIPNYDDIRQDVGFKNVYLANVVSARNFDDKPNFLTDADWALFKAHLVTALSVNVGVHELLGHGTGKLLAQRADGGFNFDRATVRDPLANAPVATWYGPSETFGGVFGAVGSSYEECRAEAVALFLCVHDDLLDIFGVATAAARAAVVHVCWLNMVHAGLLGLLYYTPETRQWQQAHMRARFCILQALLRDADPIVHITPDEREGLLITIDAPRIATDGVRVIGDLLRHLQVYKSTADAANGTRYYADLTAVDATCLRYRDVVLARRKPRSQYVQPHTTVNAAGDDADVREFDGSVDGMIASFVARHADFPL